MQSQHPKSNVIAPGDSVIVTRRIFTNHGLPVINLGKCSVISITEDHNYMLIELVFHPILLNLANNNCIRIMTRNKAKSIIRLHSVYIKKEKS